MAMTNAMASGSMDFGGAALLGLTLLGLMAGCVGGILFSRAPLVERRPRLPRMARLPRLAGVTK
ncbi:MAG: hypothetical protein U0802_19545 [Candidatus Binatia bacterium]